MKSFLLFASTISAIEVLAIFLMKWNTILNKEVKARTAELEGANKRLKNNIQMQQEFLDIAAHELRTPIQPILGLSQVLYDNHNNRQNNNSSAQNISAGHDGKVFETILRNAQRLEQLTEDLLDVTRIEGQSLRLNKEKIDLIGLVRSTVQDFRDSIANDNKVMITLLPTQPVFVNADKNRIIQVIFNLLQNAIKFTKRGTISIGIEGKGSDVIVEVRDTGVGIDREMYPRLFTKFVTNSEKGTGLGLFISKGILELHGGRIWAENNKNGIGASFKFSLPVLA